jgi:hypothetical protein
MRAGATALPTKPVAPVRRITRCIIFRSLLFGVFLNFRSNELKSNMFSDVCNNCNETLKNKKHYRTIKDCAGSEALDL